MSLLRDVEAYIDRHHLIEEGARVVVGVSGGPDSIALLHLLKRIASSRGFDLHAAHLHHGIRGESADEDMAYVAEMADSWEIAYTTQRVDVPALASREHLTLEEAARRARYRFLCRVAQQIEAECIAVAHNADDQAETVLMHLIRGAGPAGLRGMLPATRLCDYRLFPPNEKPSMELTLVRPLLGVERSEIEAYCRAHDLEPRFDRSNLDTTYFRNQLRHEVLPYLEEINPNISERLRNLAEVVRADYRLLEEFVSVAWDTLLLASHSDALVFDLKRWREQPLATQRAIVRRAAYRLRHSLRDISFDHVEQAVNLAQRGETGAQAVLPHELTLTVGYTTLILAEAGALHLPSERPWLSPDGVVPVKIPGVTPLPDGWTLQVNEASHWSIETIEQNPNPLIAWIDGDALGSSPLLRTRRRGDRFEPQGMGGSTVRLSDFLINIKMPRRWRDHLPLLTTKQGRILWVTGIRLSEAALIRPETERVIYLRFHGPHSTN